MKNFLVFGRGFARFEETIEAARVTATKYPQAAIYQLVPGSGPTTNAVDKGRESLSMWEDPNDGISTPVGFA